MSETRNLVSLESVDLKMGLSWQTTVDVQTQQKSALFSHSCLPGVEWQLELHGSQGNGVAVYLVLVTNKHNFELRVTFLIDWAGSVSGTMGKNSKQSKIRLPTGGFVTLPQHYLYNNQIGITNLPFSYDVPRVQNLAQTAAAIPVDLKCRIEVSCPLTKVPSNSAVNGQLEKLLTEAYKTDVKFVVQGVTIPAHKLLLSAASPVFDRMFADESQFEESRSNTVVVDDASAEAFEAFLRLVYTDEIDHDTLQKGDTAFEMMSLGHKYQIDSVLRRASHAIKVGLTIHTVFQAADASRLYEDKELHEACASYIAQDNNFDEISKKPEWTSFIAQNATLVGDVMRKMRHRTGP